MEVKPNGLPISSPGQLPEFFILLKDSLKTFRLPFPFFQRWEHNAVKDGWKPRSGSGSLVFTFWLCLWTRGVKQAFAAHHWHFMSNNHTREWKLTEDEAKSGPHPTFSLGFHCVSERFSLSAAMSYLKTQDPRGSGRSELPGSYGSACPHTCLLLDSVPHFPLWKTGERLLNQERSSFKWHQL